LKYYFVSKTRFKGGSDSGAAMQGEDQFTHHSEGLTGRKLVLFVFLDAPDEGHLEEEKGRRKVKEHSDTLGLSTENREWRQKGRVGKEKKKGAREVTHWLDHGNDKASKRGE